MTGLHSEAQPFIRYRTGDLVRLSRAACREGRGLHVVQEVTGRTTDFVVRSDGAVMHALAVIYVLRAVEGVAAFRLIQHGLRELEVLIVRDARWTEQSARRISDGLRARMGADVRVTIREVTEIPVEASGKVRQVVSHVQVRAGLTIAAAQEATVE